MFHDPTPYPCGDIADVYATIKESGMFRPSKRTEGVSTSDIILRVIKYRDDFMRQALEKYTPENLHISKEYAEYLKKKPKERNNLKEIYGGKETEVIDKEIKRLEQEIYKLKESLNNL